MTTPKRRSLRSEDATAQVREITPAEKPMTEEIAVVGRISVRRAWAKEVRKGAKQKLLGGEAAASQQDTDTGYAEQLLYAASQRRA
ncbi:hypothetical protein J7413_07945 [Shimia sp. R10_1]|uniref:hypothetical protein n=1 Tax=Shimia sp. R10_1 TaxID=2821095 RepID=UPI001ADD3FB3|nr:hypothetical protein [Shimia sp. R10_1]MBO9473464.1 hypothetical protein [Shimia sp. R10_1]